MFPLLQQLTEASQQTIQAGGAYWRIRRIVPSEAKDPTLALALAHQIRVAADPDRTAAEQRKASRGQPRLDAIQRTLQSMADLVYVGLLAVSEDGEKWHPIRVVADLAQARPEAGIVHISALPPGVPAQLGEAILALSVNVREAAERLATFRGDRPPGA